MRVGYNPYKDKPQEQSTYIHQIVIPVFIPNQEGYFKDSFKILQRCLQSVIATSHSRTFITAVNNGSDEKVVDYLDQLRNEGQIHELIHTHNIGKLNAILKGLAGNDIELVTIADCDVLFLSDWQRETVKVFESFPKAGVVGIVPQYLTFMSCCDHMIFSMFFDKRLKWIPVKNPDALRLFYKSIGWDDNSNPDYLNISLGMELENGLRAYVGSGHFVATYKKQMFDEMTSYIGYKMGGNSETYLDKIPLRKGYWRLTTYDNHAYHMGNVYEEWMDHVTFDTDQTAAFPSGFPVMPNSSRALFFLHTKVYKKLFKSRKMRKFFYWWKNMPKPMIPNY